MAYRQDTKCVDVKNHTGLTGTLAWGGVKAVAAALATLVFGGGLAPGAAVGALLLLIDYCKWWLYDRLICLGGDRCAIGLLQDVEPPEKKSVPDAFDTDNSFTMLLAPHGTATVGKGSEDYLVEEQDTTAKAKTLLGAKRFDFQGYKVKVPGFTTATWHYAYNGLHCEFEGGGMLKLLDAAKAALPFAVAAAAVCSIPIFGWIACAILNAIVAIISLAGVISALEDRGKPTDVNPDLDVLHRYQDILFVKGEWVYDTAHDGWNEIHPIRHCQRIGWWIGNHEKADQWAEHFEGWRRADLPPSLPSTPPLPPPLAPPASLAFLAISPDNVFGGNAAPARITFTTPPAPGSGTITLSSSDAAAVVPASLNIATKASFIDFVITTKSVTAPITAEITATFNTISQKAKLRIKPVPTAADWHQLVEDWCNAVRRGKIGRAHV